MIFQENFFSRHILSTDQIFKVWLSLPLELLDSMYIAAICFLVCDVIKFKINSILIKPF